MLLCDGENVTIGGIMQHIEAGGRAQWRLRLRRTAIQDQLLSPGHHP